MMRAVDPPPSPSLPSDAPAADRAAAAAKLSVDQALAALRADLAQQQPPARVHAALMQQFAALHGQPSAGVRERDCAATARPQATAASTAPTIARGPAGRRPRWRWAAWGGAGSGLALLSLAAAIWLSPLRGGVDDPADAAAMAGQALASGAVGEFVAVAAAGLWPAGSDAALGEGLGGGQGVGRGWIVPTELAQLQLAALGLPFDAAHADERVRAEMLVSADGQVLAVRVLGTVGLQ